MSFHVPFNQRPSGRQQLPGPIYIGFDSNPASPRPATRKFNWWGFHGMWMSFASLLTAGFLSPIPLLISLIGLRRPGKIMASVGSLVSVMGVGLATLISLLTWHANHEYSQRQQEKYYQQVTAKEVASASQLLVVAGDEIKQFQADYDGQFPDDIDANMLVIKHVDPWGQSLRFDSEKDHATIRSAGPDQKFYTDDDVTLRLEGKMQTDSTLLPIQ